MLVRTLVGRLAGEKVEMDYAQAMACIAAGTAERLDVARPPPAAAAPPPAEDDEPDGDVDIPAGWENLHWTKRMQLAKRLSGEKAGSLSLADAIIRSHIPTQ